jgi:hypothetical protein
MKQLDPITLPMPAIGTQLDSEGGFYGGLIHLGADILAIVWAPKLEGETTSKWLDTSTSVLGATSCFDSMANTLAMAAAGSDLAKKALAANIGGHTDWCIPARDVLEMGYRYLKPGWRQRQQHPFRLPVHRGQPCANDSRGLPSWKPRGF